MRLELIVKVSRSAGVPKSMNIAVMECYFLSKPVDDVGKPIRGYRRRMHKVWNERQTFKVTEQRLCDQARMSRKNGWLTQVELEEIQRKLTAEEEVTMHESQVGEEIMIPEVTEPLSEGETIIHVLENQARKVASTEAMEEILTIMKEGNMNTPISLRKVDRKAVNRVVSEVNEILSDIRTDTISDTNKLIAATAVYVGKKLGIKNTKRGYEMKEPWWKRRIKQSIIEVRKHINILERRKRGETMKENKYVEISRRYSIMKKGISNVIEELKQRLQAKACKLDTMSAKSLGTFPVFAL